MEKQTAGREAPGESAPESAHLSGDLLFGEVRAGEDLKSPESLSIAAVSALAGKGAADSSLRHHPEAARKNGAARTEMAELLTRPAFHAGRPGAWAAFRLAEEVCPGGPEEEEHGGFFGQGAPDEACAENFTGRSCRKPLTDPPQTLFIAEDAFEPGCRSRWHIHHASSGGGRILLCVDGEGWYLEAGKPARSWKPGDAAAIPAEAEHWHGAEKDSWFFRLAVESPGTDCHNERLRPVSAEEYDSLD